MKTLLINITLIIALCSITLNIADIIKKHKVKQNTEQLGYNPEEYEEKPEIITLVYNLTKDNWINDILNQTPYSVKIESAVIVYRITLKYKDIKIIVYHYLQSNDFNIFAFDNKGQPILLETFNDIPEHQIHPRTLDRIKQVCINYENQKL